MTIVEQREQAAQERFEEWDAEIIDSDGWNVDGDFWSRLVYYPGETEDDDSITGSFGVRFAPNSAEIIDEWSQ